MVPWYMALADLLTTLGWLLLAFAVVCFLGAVFGWLFGPRRERLVGEEE